MNFDLTFWIEIIIGRIITTANISQEPSQARHCLCSTDIIPLIPFTTIPGHNISFPIVPLRKLKHRDVSCLPKVTQFAVPLVTLLCSDSQAQAVKHCASPPWAVALDGREAGWPLALEYSVLTVLDNCCQTHFQLKQLGFVINTTSLSVLSWAEVAWKLLIWFLPRLEDWMGSHRRRILAWGRRGQQKSSSKVTCMGSCHRCVHFQSVTKRGTCWISKCKLKHKCRWALLS